MRVHPRQELLSIWKAVVRNSLRNKTWEWGGRDGRNSISDAEQLLCILLPATQVDTFRLERPDETSEAMIAALRPMGGATDIAPYLIGVLREYFTTYSDKETGTPVFSGGSYFKTRPGAEVTKEQVELSIVDSYSTSMTLSLATLGFVTVYEPETQREQVKADLQDLKARAQVRLSAAMIGLLRSFTVNVFTADDEEGRILYGTINQSGLPARAVVSQLRRELRETIASFSNVTIGSGNAPEDLAQSDRLFECGWSWGVVANAPVIDTVEDVGRQPDGIAIDKPYLYFTVTALDAIEDLQSERTRILNLLNEEQLRLAQALQLRYDLTRSYWAAVATFGTGRWPVEDIPWRTVDDVESVYFTLLVTSLAVKGLARERGSDTELSRIGDVLINLAERARLITRPLKDDPMLLLHVPGVLLNLEGTETVGPPLHWPITEFAALLMQRTHAIAGLLGEAQKRSELIDLADRVWDHLGRRRINDAPGQGLWDQPKSAFAGIDTHYDLPSWYYTVRVVQALVAAAKTVVRPTLRSDALHSLALDLLNEADHLFDKELLAGSIDGRGPLSRELQRVRADLLRARELVSSRPGTSTALTIEALQKLDQLENARKNVSED
ncbi:SCO2524 family protein [Dactylosporangium sp. NPDC000521]|uniref:SCO2524 family protein n=1 Tax=Dactylosporangium sp. NPDC000521 TaxID=3363975 RepID=UPI0036CA39C4